MFKNLGYYMILGKPLNFYLGLSTLISFLLTALIAFLNKRGIHKIPFKYHQKMAAVSIILAFIHGLIALLAYL